jgi:hypothetical protein
MTVVETSGGVGYRVSGKVYKSPSGAAKAITKCAANGWRWWHIDGSLGD